MVRKSRANSVVDKLIEQRRLIQEWLRKLDAGQTNGMSEKVVQRVRNDYASRLEAITAELGEHADSVRQGLDEAQARHEE
ncbi:MAG TPA: hypothetical protein VLV15_01040, partial [Dongiaceae bacterium]|nr:hypothetical protein [Dongiaceae bacterium]